MIESETRKEKKILSLLFSFRFVLNEFVGDRWHHVVVAKGDSTAIALLSQLIKSY